MPLLQGPCRPPGGLPGRGRGNGPRARRAPRGTRVQCRRQGGRRVPRSCDHRHPRPVRGADGHLRRPRRAARPPSPPCSSGAAWPRCRMHFLRNVLAQVPKGSAEMVAAVIRTIFVQPWSVHVAEQLDTIATMLGGQFPKVEQILRVAQADISAFVAFPVSHWKKIWSTNPLERVNKAIRPPHRCRRSLSNPAALLRLVGEVLPEAHHEMADRPQALPVRRLPGIADRRPRPQGGGAARTAHGTGTKRSADQNTGEDYLHHAAGRDLARCGDAGRNGAKPDALPSRAVDR
jgi:hypothetical protein